MWKRTLAGVVAGLLFFAGVYVFYSVSLVKEKPVHINIAYTVDYEQMAQFADLIVLGSAQEPVERRDAVIQYFPSTKASNLNGAKQVESMITYTKLKIDEIYKDKNGAFEQKNAKITVIEPFVLLHEWNGKSKYIQEGYTEMKMAGSYLLFLKQSPKNDHYYIIRDNDGKEEILAKDEQERQAEIKSVLLKHNVKSAAAQSEQ